MPLQEKLQLWQKDFIDISRRNALLYYSDVGRGAGVRLQFRRGDAACAADRAPQTPHALDQLPTNLEEEDLARKLKRLRANARDDLNERGIHTLYLAFGLLEWFEAPQSEESVHSPLLLMPVALKSQGAWGAITLEAGTLDDMEINPALREVLGQQFNLRLPSYEEIKRQLADEGDEESQRAAMAHPGLADILAVIEEAGARAAPLACAGGGASGTLLLRNW